MRQKTLAIIDGDVLAYQSCFPRPVPATLALDANGDAVYPYTKEEDTKYMKECWVNFQRNLDKLLETVFCTEYVMAVKGNGCYRKELYPDYKLQRHGENAVKRYMDGFVGGLRNLAVLALDAIPSIDCEADDLVRIWAEEARAAGRSYIICSIDKDLRCIPGNHYVMHYIPEKTGPLVVTEDAAMRHYYVQLIMGDPTDNIPGCKGIGPKKAEAMIAPCVTENDMQEAVVNAYLTCYGSTEWYGMFLSNAKLIHIQTRWDDYFEPYGWEIIQELRGA
jgi:DNA polymerase-1